MPGTCVHTLFGFRGKLFDKVDNKRQHEIKNNEKNDKVKHIVKDLSRKASGSNNAYISWDKVEGVQFKKKR